MYLIVNSRSQAVFPTQMGHARASSIRLTDSTYSLQAENDYRVLAETRLKKITFKTKHQYPCFGEKSVKKVCHILR